MITGGVLGLCSGKQSGSWKGETALPLAGGSRGMRRAQGYPTGDCVSPVVAHSYW